MARMAADRHAGPSAPIFMDRLSHEVIKETSKNLRHYMDVRRREDGFILNPNSSALESAPVRARHMYGTAKQYPPLYGTSYSDHDIKIYMRNFHKQQRQAHPKMDPSEKRLCREELNYHLGPNRSMPKENQKFADLRLKPAARSASMSSVASARDYRQGPSQSAPKLSRQGQRLLVDDTATILASMLKTRQSVYDTQRSLHETPHAYISRHTNPSPRPSDDRHSEKPKPSVLPRPSIDSGASISHPSDRKSKKRTKTTEEKSLFVMHKAKPVPKGILCDYKISVTTGNHNGASSEAPIQIKLYGTNGYTAFKELTDSETHRVPFTKEQTDLFTVRTDHVGRLAGITIGHDRKDIRSGWFLEKVSIFDPIREVTSEIPCNAWLSSKSNDGKTMRDFPVTAKVSRKETRGSTERDEILSNESYYSTTSMEGTVTSSTTISIDNDRRTTQKKTKKPHRKQALPHPQPPMSPPLRRLSPLSPPTPRANHHVHSPPLAKKESRSDREEMSSPPPIPVRRTASPLIAPDTDTEIEEIHNRRSRSSSPRTPTLTRIVSAAPRPAPSTTSDEQERPPARLARRPSPAAVSPERPMKRKEEKDDDDAGSFFE